MSRAGFGRQGLGVIAETSGNRGQSRPPVTSYLPPRCDANPAENRARGAGQGGQSGRASRASLRAGRWGKWLSIGRRRGQRHGPAWSGMTRSWWAPRRERHRRSRATRGRRRSRRAPLGPSPRGRFRVGCDASFAQTARPALARARVRATRRGRDLRRVQAAARRARARASRSSRRRLAARRHRRDRSDGGSTKAEQLSTELVVRKLRDEERVLEDSAPKPRSDLGVLARVAESARGPRCPGAASLGLRTEPEPLYVVDVPIRLVDDFLALPSVEHGRDPARSVDLRQHAGSSGVAGGYAARVAAARCHGFKASISR